ncbi:YceD family protein [Thioclava sp. A2]|uniref:YceD family protein n=1 Tax=Thioclava sp. FCG-A2 TaxID=3080562 RepID=UPI00295505FA|nr:YceD family protein [Thioclava sp. A2]MDV7269579.1 YceD family protein [Thioclava sp. A2]
MSDAPISNNDLPWSHPFRVADLPGRKATRFDISPDAATRAQIAEWAGIDALKSLSFKGELRPAGKRDYTLTGTFSARVVQPCAITLAPVTTNLNEAVTRHYIAGYEMPTAEETEMPEDESIEALPVVIDAAAVALEALELALPLFPRAEGAELGEAQVTEPGIKPMTDEDTRPFANLKNLLSGGKNESDNND